MSKKILYKNFFNRKKNCVSSGFTVNILQKLGTLSPFFLRKIGIGCNFSSVFGFYHLLEDFIEFLTTKITVNDASSVLGEPI